MKRNLNLNSFSLKLCVAEYVCKATAIPTSNKAVLIICHVTVQEKKSEGLKPKKPRKYLSKGELDNHCTSLLKVSSDMIEKKISRNNRLLFRSQ